ncbi:MAG: methionyl-tRNA formyltransferase [Candidatus Gastranaerophilales bacterium]|nr:methionyl-tRNA formyltransferase [Candidatus Gastranaerophilales bacterium]
MRVIIAGYGEMAASLLLGVLESGHEVVGIFRHDRVTLSPVKRFLKDVFNAEEFFVLAKKYKIKEIKAKSINSEEFFKKAFKLHPDVILVGSWGEVLEPKIINMPRVASVNTHPSLLPKYRGPNPYLETIRNGETQTGVTFHLISEKLDRGPVLMQQKVDITPDDTGGSLRNKCVFTARQMVKELLDGLNEGTTMPLVQDEKLSSYYPRIKLHDTIINWEQSAYRIYDQIRAMNPWQHCFLMHKRNILQVNSAKVVDIEENLPPGMVTFKKGSSLIISTGLSGHGVLFEKPEVFGFMGFLFGKIYIRSKIKVGDFLEKV